MGSIIIAANDMPAHKTPAQYNKGSKHFLLRLSSTSISSEFLQSKIINMSIYYNTCIHFDWERNGEVVNIGAEHG